MDTHYLIKPTKNTSLPAESSSTSLSIPQPKSQCQRKVFTYNVKYSLNRRSASYIHSRIADEIMHILGDSMKFSLEKYMINLIKVTELCMEQLKGEMEFNQVKMMGMVVTFSSVNRLLFAILSICLTAYEVFIHK